MKTRAAATSSAERAGITLAVPENAERSRLPA